MTINVGDRVWYWSRRRGERAHIKYGTVIQSDGTMARVRLDNYVDGTSPAVLVQSVEVKRLHIRTSNS